jgi:hypothetical protein
LNELCRSRVAELEAQLEEEQLNLDDEMHEIECEFSVQHLQDDDYAQSLIAEISHCRGQLAHKDKELETRFQRIEDRLNETGKKHQTITIGYACRIVRETKEQSK